jgi:4-hydroxy-4-methyl-2-oxoglutarate aldolase
VRAARSDSSLTTPQRSIATANVAQVLRPGEGGLIRGLRVLSGGSFHGPAHTCACVRGDNLALHTALRDAEAGYVIVCDAMGDLDHGYFGELMAAAAIGRGILALVIDGSVRDLDALQQRGFPTVAAGLWPVPGVKSAVGSVGEPIEIRGVRVAYDDVIVADADGVVVVQQASWDDVLHRVHELQAKEQDILRELESGETLWNLLHLVDAD